MNVNINQHNVDQVSLDFLTTGSSECMLMSKETPLDNSKDYVFCITELQIPTNGLPLFLPGLENTILFNIKKRLIGAGLDDLALDTEEDNQFFTKGRTLNNDNNHFYSVASFLSEMNAWVNTFSKRRIDNGMLGVDYGGVNINPDLNPGAPIELLKLGIDPTGKLKFKGTSYFWDRFMIVPTPYAIKLFHLENIVNNGVISVTFLNGNVTLSGVVDGNNQIIAGNNPGTVTVSGNLSIFTNLDHRHEILVESHLNIPSQIEIRDGVELNDRNVARVPFLNSSRVSLSMYDDVFDGKFKIETEAYLGRHSFIKKTDRFKEWISLNTSYELRYFRFLLYCSYRVFDNASSTFKIKKIEVPIDTTDFWQMTVRFVSIV